VNAEALSGQSRVHWFDFADRLKAVPFKAIPNQRFLSCIVQPGVKACPFCPRHCNAEPAYSVLSRCSARGSPGDKSGGDLLAATARVGAAYLLLVDERLQPRQALLQVVDLVLLGGDYRVFLLQFVQ